MCRRYWANQCVPIKHDPLSKLNTYWTCRKWLSFGSHCPTHQQRGGPHCYPAVSNPAPTFHFRILLLGSLLVSIVVGWVTQDIDFRTQICMWALLGNTFRSNTWGREAGLDRWSWTVQCNYNGVLRRIYKDLWNWVVLSEKSFFEARKLAFVSPSFVLFVLWL